MSSKELTTNILMKEIKAIIRNKVIIMVIEALNGITMEEGIIIIVEVVKVEDEEGIKMAGITTGIIRGAQMVIEGIIGIVRKIIMVVIIEQHLIGYIRPKPLG